MPPAKHNRRAKNNLKILDISPARGHTGNINPKLLRVPDLAHYDVSRLSNVRSLCIDKAAPGQICQLKNLREIILNLVETNFKGNTIFNELIQLTKLECIDLGYVNYDFYFCNLEMLLQLPHIREINLKRFNTLREISLNWFNTFEKINILETVKHLHKLRNVLSKNKYLLDIIIELQPKLSTPLTQYYLSKYTGFDQNLKICSRSIELLKTLHHGIYSKNGSLKLQIGNATLIKIASSVTVLPEIIEVIEFFIQHAEELKKLAVSINSTMHENIRNRVVQAALGKLFTNDNPDSFREIKLALPFIPCIATAISSSFDSNDSLEQLAATLDPLLRQLFVQIQDPAAPSDDYISAYAHTIINSYLTEKYENALMNANFEELSLALRKQINPNKFYAIDFIVKELKNNPQYCSLSKMRDIAKLLLEHGANPFTKEDGTSYDLENYLNLFPECTRWKELEFISGNKGILHDLIEDFEQLKKQQQSIDQLFETIGFQKRDRYTNRSYLCDGLEDIFGPFYQYLCELRDILPLTELSIQQLEKLAPRIKQLKTFIEQKGRIEQLCSEAQRQRANFSKSIFDTAVINFIINDEQQYGEYINKLRELCPELKNHPEIIQKAKDCGMMLKKALHPYNLICDNHRHIRLILPGFANCAKDQERFSNFSRLYLLKIALQTADLDLLEQISESSSFNINQIIDPISLDSALHVVVRELCKGRQATSEIVRKLVAMGANRSKANALQETPASIAQKTNNQQVLRILGL